ncbi:hypothetical protein Areg01_12770 [Actinoplanes regularis]|nr:hypothetical protein Areg01_12770 [Actinoplanes regularis]
MPAGIARNITTIRRGSCLDLPEPADIGRATSPTAATSRGLPEPADIAAETSTTHAATTRAFLGRPATSTPDSPSQPCTAERNECFRAHAAGQGLRDAADTTRRERNRRGCCVRTRQDVNEIGAAAAYGHDKT